jgi:hypothetical protein
VFDSKSAWRTLLGLAAAVLVAAMIFSGKFSTGLIFVMCLLAFALSLAGMIVYLRDSREKLAITSRCIYRKSIFGKHTYISTDCICGVEMTCFGTVYVRTTCGNFRCCLLRNKEEVFSEIKNLLDNKKAE